MFFIASLFDIKSHGDIMSDNITKRDIVGLCYLRYYTLHIFIHMRSFVPTFEILIKTYHLIIWLEIIQNPILLWKVIAYSNQMWVNYTIFVDTTGFPMVLCRKC